MIVMVFAATHSELAKVQQSCVLDPTEHRLAAVEIEAQDPLALVSFDATLTGDDEEQIRAVVLGNPVAILDGGEQLVFAVRPEVVEALRGASGVTSSRVAARWAAAGGRGQILADLIALVSQAGDQRGLYSWLSL